MFIVYLTYGPRRSHAREWMEAHDEWIRRGFDDGVFVLTGSLDDGRGGIVLAANVNASTLAARVGSDPFVQQAIVTAEIHAFTPSRIAAAIKRRIRPLQRG